MRTGSAGHGRCVYVEENEAPVGRFRCTARLASLCTPTFHRRIDVEVDLNPYMPDDPFDWPEVHRQASVILQVVPSS